MRNSTQFHPPVLRATLVAIIVLCTSQAVLAQSPPVDLTELSLEDLLRVQLVDHTFAHESVQPRPHSKTRVGYRYARTQFEDYLDGTTDLSAEDVLQEYPVAPSLIVQEAHIITVSHRATETLTLMVEAALIQQRTDHIRRSGDPFTIRTEGMSDLQALGILRVMDKAEHQLYFSAGLSLPTGSIDETGDTPRGKDTAVPYTMQIGSGTYDFKPGILYATHNDKVNWGAQLNATFRIGRNDKDYSLGDVGTFTSWLKTCPTPWLSPSAKLTVVYWDSIDGQDADLNPAVAPVADPDLFGGVRMLASAGVEISPPQESLQGWTFFAEAGAPFYQSLNGPQPAQQWQLSASLVRGF